MLVTRVIVKSAKQIVIKRCKHRQHNAANRDHAERSQYREQTKDALRMIHAVSTVPDGFGAVQTISPSGEQAIAITDENGQALQVTIDWPFVL